MKAKSTPGYTKCANSGCEPRLKLKAVLVMCLSQITLSGCSATQSTALFSFTAYLYSNALEKEERNTAILKL